MYALAPEIFTPTALATPWMVIPFVLCIALLPCDSSTKTDSFCFCCSLPEGFLVSSFFTRFSPSESELYEQIFQTPKASFSAAHDLYYDLQHLLSYT
jgi:hypothetical protein